MEIQEENVTCECKMTHREEITKKKLSKRIKTLEGQLRGVDKMIEDDKYCVDILIQLLAINKSIKSLSTEILKDHLSSCVVKGIKEGDKTVIDEVMNIIGRFD